MQTFRPFSGKKVEGKRGCLIALIRTTSFFICCRPLQQGLHSPLQLLRTSLRSVTTNGVIFLLRYAPRELRRNCFATRPSSKRRPLLLLGRSLRFLGNLGRSLRFLGNLV